MARVARAETRHDDARGGGHARRSARQTVRSETKSDKTDRERRMNGDPPQRSSSLIASHHVAQRRARIAFSQGHRLHHALAPPAPHATRGSRTSPSGCHRVSTGGARARRAALRLLARDVRRRHVRHVRRGNTTSRTGSRTSASRSFPKRFLRRNVFFEEKILRFAHVTSSFHRRQGGARRRSAEDSARRRRLGTPPSSSVSQGPERRRPRPSGGRAEVRRTRANVASACDPAATISAPSATRTSPSGIASRDRRPEPPPRTRGPCARRVALAPATRAATCTRWSSRDEGMG